MGRATSGVGLLAALSLGGAGLLLSGCGRPDAVAETWVGERDSRGDTTIVLTRSGSVWESSSLEPELRIGAVEGAEHEMFGDIVGLAVGPNGDLYVYDRIGPRFRWYSADGGYRGLIGRGGGGPGEFAQSDGGLAVLADGRVLLRDPGGARFVTFTAQGEYLATLPGPAGFFTTRQPTPLSNGGFVNPVSMPGVPGTFVASHDSSGVPRDTLRVPIADVSVPTVTAQNADGDRRVTRALPFSPRAIWTINRDGEFVTAVTDKAAMDIHRHDGTVFRIAKDGPAVAVSTQERAYEETRLQTAMREVDPTWDWNDHSIPTRKPFLQRIFVSSDNRLWVQVHQPAEMIRSGSTTRPGEGPPVFEPVVFDIFEPDGVHLGRLRAPAGFQVTPPPVFGPDRVWAVVHDDIGVQHLVRFRIVPVIR